MNYDENVFKEKANIKARRIWLVFALLLTANYGSDAANGLYPSSSSKKSCLAAALRPATRKKA